MRLARLVAAAAVAAIAADIVETIAFDHLWIVDV